MKGLFILLALSLFACSLSAQADFNYSFYPAPKYTNVNFVNQRDTVTGEIVAKSDTIEKVVNVVIEKQNGRLSIRTLSNISETIYDANVRFIGFDTNGNLTYKSKPDEQKAGMDPETIFVSPERGVVEIVFTKCFDEPQPGNLVKKYCDVNRHIFGNIPKPVLLEKERPTVLAPKH